MGISNDWQVLDNLTYVSVSSARFLTEDSCHIIADAIGWEVVHLADYTDSVNIRDTAYDTTNIYLIRPIADAYEEEYNCAISLFAYQSLSTWMAGDFVFDLSTGTFVTSIDSSISTAYASVMLLRPTTQGGFSIRQGNVYHYFDKFFNPKTEAEKWGVFNSLVSNTGFVDLYSGLFFRPNQLSVSLVDFEVGGFVALKKLTVISSAGVFNAKTIYRFIVDYNSLVKTVELNGIKYVNVDGRYMYIRLAE